MLILEVTLALLILSRGRWVKVGAILFLVGISPLGFDVMPNLLLAGALVYLLTQDFRVTRSPCFATDVAAGPLRRSAIVKSGAQLPRLVTTGPSM